MKNRQRPLRTIFMLLLALAAFAVVAYGALVAKRVVDAAK